MHHDTNFSKRETPMQNVCVLWAVVLDLPNQSTDTTEGDWRPNLLGKLPYISVRNMSFPIAIENTKDSFNWRVSWQQSLCFFNMSI
jgi:hypothetical protein